MSSELSVLTDRPNSAVRPTWANDREFFLACLGYCVGLANVWRFSYLCYANGGGAFLVPYILVAVFVVMPMYFLEAAIGQFMKKGPIGVFNMVPVMKGVGFGMVVACLYSTMYYIQILAWGMFYFVHSFTTEDMPWSTYDNWWNTDSCRIYIDLFGGNMTTNSTLNASINQIAVDFTSTNSSNATQLPVVEFWKHYVLRQSPGIDYIGTVSNWKMVLCFLVSWFLCYLCAFKGVKSTGKVVYFTATFPYVILTILVVRGLTLEGAEEGIKFYLLPNFSKLGEPMVWMQAGSQVFYSYGICFTVIIAFGSYNNFNMDCFKHVVAITATSSATSLYAGFSVFGVIGHLAHVTHKNVSEVVDSGLICGIEDLWPNFVSKYPRERLTLYVCVVMVILGIPMTFGCGIYLFELINSYSVGGFCLFSLVFFESISFAYVYGLDQLYEDLKAMIGYYPTVCLKVCYKIIIPGLSLTILIFSMTRYTPLKLGSYDYPPWANAIGWITAISSVSMVPLVIMYCLYKADGNTLLQKWKHAKKPKYSDHLRHLGYEISESISIEKKLFV